MRYIHSDKPRIILTIYIQSLYYLVILSSLIYFIEFKSQNIFYVDCVHSKVAYRELLWDLLWTGTIRKCQFFFFHWLSSKSNLILHLNSPTFLQLFPTNTDAYTLLYSFIFGFFLSFFLFSFFLFAFILYAHFCQLIFNINLQLIFPFVLSYVFVCVLKYT